MAAGECARIDPASTAICLFYIGMAFAGYASKPAEGKSEKENEAFQIVLKRLSYMLLSGCCEPSNRQFPAFIIS
jgi:hypothetical protein